MLLDNNMFEICWLFNGRVRIRGFNGKYLVSKGIGNLVVCILEDVDDSGFQIWFFNCLVIVFWCEFGFIGIKIIFGSNNDEYICIKVYLSVIILEQMNDGKYSLWSENGKYWCFSILIGGYFFIKVNSVEFVLFVMEFWDFLFVIILVLNGCYLYCDKVGYFYVFVLELDVQCLLYC